MRTSLPPRLSLRVSVYIYPERSETKGSKIARKTQRSMLKKGWLGGPNFPQETQIWNSIFIVRKGKRKGKMLLFVRILRNAKSTFWDRTAGCGQDHLGVGVTDVTNQNYYIILIPIIFTYNNLFTNNNLLGMKENYLSIFTITYITFTSGIGHWSVHTECLICSCRKDR